MLFQSLLLAIVLLLNPPYDGHRLVSTEEVAPSHSNVSAPAETITETQIPSPCQATDSTLLQPVSLTEEERNAPDDNGLVNGQPATKGILSADGNGDYAYGNGTYASDDNGDVAEASPDPNGDSGDASGDDSGTPSYRPADSGTLPANAANFVAVCQEELRMWEAGEVGHRRYEDPFEENGDGSGWCGMFIGFCAGRIGSSCIHWQGDAFPGDTTWPGGYHDYYTNHPDMGTLYDADGQTLPQPGDIVIMWGGAHVEMVEAIDSDGGGYWCIAGGGSVDHNWHAIDDGNVTWFVTPNWNAIGQ